MRFCCPFCHFTISAEPSEWGHSTDCPGCGQKVVIPSGRFDEGCIIGDFIINSHLGRGSIGDVYKATQISLDRPVALKILTPKFMTKQGMMNFLKEARSAAPLSHMNLVQSYAVGMDDGCLYMAMTYIKGETLRARLKREGRIPVDESLHIIQQVAEALYYAWDESHIIHRDVKPENIMLTEKGIVKLTDLGLAMSQSDWSENMEISGSPSYMSPEQFSGEKLDTRSDIYSLGVTLYQMISGRLPYDAATVTSVMRQHFEETPPALDRLVPGVPAKVVALVEKMMEKDADKRFANMDELLREIWTIRQKTAPVRDMIPDIHTISIKRLDYEFQNEHSVRVEKLKSVDSALPVDSAILSPQPGKTGKRRMIRWILPGTGILLLALAVLYLRIGSGEAKRIQEAEREMAVFEKLAQDPAFPANRLSAEGEQLIRKYGKDFRSRRQFRFAEDHIRYLVMKRRYAEQFTPFEESGDAEKNP